MYLHGCIWVFGSEWMGKLACLHFHQTRTDVMDYYSRKKFLPPAWLPFNGFATFALAAVG